MGREEGERKRVNERERKGERERELTAITVVDTMIHVLYYM